ncbi:hypothetical protein Vau01_121580 [Virgisporangium aurantiacum]|uniref:Tetratricopeptide repeat-containing protein n=1 Tax=Virgisporangium aurantiacum TaxID=175570 RepID=A0A8J3ZKI7_9ACTN|nr:hypothetical protein Vau01_121580 [Virgisporangium aurantiacum]
MFRRRCRSRKLVVLAVFAVACGLVALWTWWQPAGQRLPRFGWQGFEQAGWVAGLVGVALALVSFVFDRIEARREQASRRAAAGGVLQIGRVPLPASWFQHRATAEALTRAAQAGRTAVLTQVLSGMGGVGKTQLAAEFARRLSDELDLLVWVTASDRGAIVAAYAETARTVGVAEPEVEPEPAAARLLGWLERTDQRWLVVLDNLDRPADATGWWPPTNSNGCTVVTTRRRDAALQAQGRTLIEVGLFTPDEAVAYLTHAIETLTPPEHLQELAAALGYLPLALAQAAAYIRERRIDCTTYQQQLANQRRLTDLLPAEDGLPDEHQHTVASTWALSITAADNTPPRALASAVLVIAALLDPNTIPADLFITTPIRDHLTAHLGGVAVGEQAVADGLHTLHRLNLLTHDRDRSSVRVHALVQHVTRDQLTPEALASAAHAAANALLAIWPDVERDTTYAQILRANTTALYHHTADALLTPEGNRILFRAARSLGEAGLFQPAITALQQLLADQLRVLGLDHPDTLTTRNNLARWRGKAGNPAGAAAAFEQLLADRLRVLGPDHPDTLTTRGNLAHWRGKTGDPAGAVTAFEQLLADQLRVLGPDHPDTLTTRGNLAHWRGKTGDPAGAVTAFEQLLADRLRVLGPDHPDTLTTRSSLAYWQRRPR